VSLICIVKSVQVCFFTGVGIISQGAIEAKLIQELENHYKIEIKVADCYKDKYVKEQRYVEKNKCSKTSG